MQLTSYGAAREVTGSCHLLEVEGCRLLLDCGMFQGGDERHERNRAPFPFDPASIDFCLLSHAHIDHCGRLPLLCRQGFKGKILATDPTVELCHILLRDSAHLQEEDAKWKIKRLNKDGADASWVTPLYTVAEAEATFPFFESVPYGSEFNLTDKVSLAFRDAGHILGSAVVDVHLRTPKGPYRFAFSGDLGPWNRPILRDPTTVPEADALVTESTYGARLHETVDMKSQMLLQAIVETMRRGGNVVIPAFAVGRTQELLYCLNDFVNEGKLKGLTAFVDSPMAVAVTELVRRSSDTYDEEAKAHVSKGDDPFDFPGLQLVTTVDESKAINEYRKPCVIISASGMCTGGRIKHHLKHNLSRKESTILLVGFQAEGTLGRRLHEGEKEVRIFGEMLPVRAEVRSIGGFSGHADSNDLRRWNVAAAGHVSKIVVVHGEEKSALRFADMLQRELNFAPTVASYGEPIALT